MIAAAEADAEKARLTGEGEKSRRSALAEAEAIEGAKRGEAEKARRVAEADAVRAEGEGQGAAILAAGQAEAMDTTAEAFAGYNEAAVLQMLVEVLPKVAAELARPMSGIDELTVISADGAGELPRQVSNNLVQTMELLKTTTGLDVESLIQKYASTRSAPAVEAAPAAPPVAGDDKA